MRVQRCALRRAAVLRLLICLLACGDGGGGGGSVRASECCRCRRAWRRRSRRFCCPGRLALTCCCLDGCLACIACLRAWLRARFCGRLAGWLLGCVWIRVCACVRMRPADAILRSARGGATRRRMRYDAVLATHGARMACGWRHGAALAWRLHAHALTRAARWVDVADWRCCMATRRRRSALACGDACHHHHRCRRHHHYHDDDDVNNDDDDDAGGDR